MTEFGQLVRIRVRLTGPASVLESRVLSTITGRSSAWLEHCVRDAEVASSNLVAPTILYFGPFGENVERLSLFSD